eukprot:6487473-Amphidinium_carterae.2
MISPQLKGNVSAYARWAGVFERPFTRVPHSPSPSAHKFLAYMALFDWPCGSDIMPQDVESVLQRVASTAPGPDGITYAHLKVMQKEVSLIVWKAMQTLAAAMPVTWADRVTVCVFRKNLMVQS